MPTPRTVLFVCAHGAYRSRLAAAFFNAAAPADRMIAIDCAAPGADRWDLAIGAVGPAQRDEIRARAEALAADLSAG